MKHAVALIPGSPYPLGASWDGEGVNFALFSANAERVELCLFTPDGSRELQRLELPTIRTALVLAARADRIMKGAELGEDWDALLQLCELLSHPGAVGHPAFSTTTCH